MKHLKNPVAWMPLVIALSLIGGIWIGITFSDNSRTGAGEKNCRKYLD